jgi:hypothetical protein
MKIKQIMQYNLRKTKYVTIGTIPKSNIEIVERGNIDTTNIQIHYHSLSWLGTGTSITSGGVRLAL